MKILEVENCTTISNPTSLDPCYMLLTPYEYACKVGVLRITLREYSDLGKYFCNGNTGTFSSNAETQTKISLRGQQMVKIGEGLKQAGGAKTQEAKGQIQEGKGKRLKA